MEKRRQPEVIAGRINADGTIAAGDGFMVQKSATGTYQVLFPSSFRPVSLTANYSVWESGGSVTVNVVAGGFQVATFNTGGGGVDKAFHFIAAGVQQ